MVFAKQIEESLFEFAPKELALDGDNVGLLVENDAEVTGVLCALDITQEVVQEAIQKRCNIIVAHHPIIFRPIYTVKTGGVVHKLAKNNIAAICMHTNADCASGGVNDTLCEALGLKNVRNFGGELGRIGELAQRKSADEFAKMCREVFGTCRATRYNGTVKTVAVVGGSGSDYVCAAFESGADAFVTGEAAHHCAIEANHEGKMLVTAGHFETERPVVQKFAQFLISEFPQLNIYQSEEEKNPFSTF